MTKIHGCLTAGAGAPLGVGIPTPAATCQRGSCRMQNVAWLARGAGAQCSQAGIALPRQQHAQATVATVGGAQSLGSRHPQLCKQLLFDVLWFDGHTWPSSSGHRLRADRKRPG